MSPSKIAIKILSFGFATSSPIVVVDVTFLFRINVGSLVFPLFRFFVTLCYVSWVLLVRVKSMPGLLIFYLLIPKQSILKLGTPPFLIEWVFFGLDFTILFKRNAIVWNAIKLRFKNKPFHLPFVKNVGWPSKTIDQTVFNLVVKIQLFL